MEEKKDKNYLQAALLFLMLIVLPAGSWIYMNLGYNRSKLAIQEMQRYGQLPAFELTGVNGVKLDSSLVNGQMTLVSFIKPNSASSKSRLKTLGLLHKQFDERNDFKLLIHLPEGTDVAELKKEYSLTDKEQVYAGNLPLAAEQRLIDQTYHIPDFDQPRIPGSTLAFKKVAASSLTDYPFFILIDEKGIIRNYYPADQSEEIERMVEQIALTLPRNIEGDPRLRRGKEL